MEQITEVVAAHAELVGRAIRIRHSRKQSALKSAESLLLLRAKVTAFDEPFVRRNRDFVDMLVAAKLEVQAIGFEIGECDVFGRC